jgi:hypothetical protein
LISEAIKGSFDESVQSIKTTTGGHVPKRQALMLVDDASKDFCAFYERVRFSKPEDTHDLLVMSIDGKGVVMRRCSAQFFVIDHTLG